MRYFLRQFFLGNKDPGVEISKTEYENICYSWSALLGILSIEEQWECLIQNYLELEVELLQAALHSMVSDDFSYALLNDTVLTISRKVSNFLHTCRAYLDHTPRHLKKTPKEELAVTFKALKSEQYDKHFSYRFMEDLRNYSQHRGLSIHGAVFHNGWIETQTEESENIGYMRHAVSPKIDVAYFKGDSDFKTAKSGELDKITSKLDVVTLVREYLESLACVHNGLRKAADLNVASWKYEVLGAIEHYEQHRGGLAPTGLNAIACGADRKIVSQIALFRLPVERLEYLKRKNGSLMNLSRRYVSNEIVKPR